MHTLSVWTLESPHAHGMHSISLWQNFCEGVAMEFTRRTAVDDLVPWGDPRLERAAQRRPRRVVARPEFVWATEPDDAAAP